jgi:hypothetical protein
VAEHRAWLRTCRPCAVDAAERDLRQRLAGCLAAARAALFFEAVSAGEPALAVTFAAVAEALAERLPSSRVLVEDAYGWYSAKRKNRTRGSAVTVNAVTSLVNQLGVYRGA